MSLKWCALFPWTHSLCLYHKNGLCSQHFPVTSVSREILAKEEPKLKTSAKHSMWNAGNKRTPEQAEPPSGTAPHTGQDEKVTADTSAPSVCSEMQCPSQDDPQQMWEQQEAPCWTVPAFISWGGQVIWTFKFSVVPFFHLLLSTGAKLHTGIPAQFLKYPQRKYFPQSSSKSFSPTFFPNKEVKKQPTLPINTAGGSTKHSSKFFHLLTQAVPWFNTFFSFAFHGYINMKI